MKYFIISLFLISFVGFIIPQVFSAGENFFYGTATFERLPTTIVPNSPTKFEIKFHYTAGSYALENLTPVIEVSPEGARSKVHFDVKPVSAYQNDIVRIPVTITVDPDMEYEKIFLSISYVGMGLHNVPFKSSWSDSIIFDIHHDIVKEKIPSSNNEKRIILSTLKQFKSGIPIDKIQCKEGLQLVTKASNGNPACVTSHTKGTLIQRGWTESQDSFVSKILTELRRGSQPITAEQGEFIKKIALMDSTIQEFVKDKTWDFDCCSYLTSNSEPKNLDVVITFFDYDNKKQLEAVMDLQEVRVVTTQIYDTVHLDEPIK